MTVNENTNVDNAELEGETQSRKKLGGRSVFNLLLNIRDCHRYKGAKRALLDALALRAGTNKQFCCWPSYRMLSLDTGYEHETLMKAVKELEGDRAIQRRKRKQTSNKYYINFDLILLWAEEARSAEVEAEVDDFEPPWKAVHASARVALTPASQPASAGEEVRTGSSDWDDDMI